MTIDKELHIIRSAALTLTIGAIPALLVGVLIEVNDHCEFKTPIKHYMEDMVFNIIGVGIALTLKSKHYAK